MPNFANRHMYMYVYVYVDLYVMFKYYLQSFGNECEPSLSNVFMNLLFRWGLKSKLKLTSSACRSMSRGDGHYQSALNVGKTIFRDEVVSASENVLRSSRKGKQSNVANEKKKRWKLKRRRSLQDHFDSFKDLTHLIRETKLARSKTVATWILN